MYLHCLALLRLVSTCTLNQHSIIAINDSLSCTAMNTISTIPPPFTFDLSSDRFACLISYPFISFSFQVERVHEQLNSDAAYRAAYFAANRFSTIRRFRSTDTRRLGVDEDPANLLDIPARSSVTATATASSAPDYSGTNGDVTAGNEKKTKPSASGGKSGKEEVKGGGGAAGGRGRSGGSSLQEASKKAPEPAAAAAKVGKQPAPKAGSSKVPAPMPVIHNMVNAGTDGETTEEEERAIEERRKEEAIKRAREGEERRRKAAERAAQRAAERAAKEEEAAARRRERVSECVSHGVSDPHP